MYFLKRAFLEGLEKTLFEGGRSFIFPNRKEFGKEIKKDFDVMIFVPVSALVRRNAEFL